MIQNMRLRCWDKLHKRMMPSFPLYKACFAHYDRAADMIIVLGTGLKDKTGKEIYEGDLLLDELGRQWEVCFEKAAFFASNAGYGADYLYSIIDKNVVITGNIHENKNRESLV